MTNFSILNKRLAKINNKYLSYNFDGMMEAPIDIEDNPEEIVDDYNKWVDEATGDKLKVPDDVYDNNQNDSHLPSKEIQKVENVENAKNNYGHTKTISEREEPDSIVKQVNKHSLEHKAIKDMFNGNIKGLYDDTPDSKRGKYVQQMIDKYIDGLPSNSQVEAREFINANLQGVDINRLTPDGAGHIINVMEDKYHFKPEELPQSRTGIPGNAITDENGKIIGMQGSVGIDLSSTQKYINEKFDEAKTWLSNTTKRLKQQQELSEKYEAHTIEVVGEATQKVGNSILHDLSNIRDKLVESAKQTGRELFDEDYKKYLDSLKIDDRTLGIFKFLTSGNPDEEQISKGTEMLNKYLESVPNEYKQTVLDYIRVNTKGVNLEKKMNTSFAGYLIKSLQTRFNEPTEQDIENFYKDSMNDGESDNSSLYNPDANSSNLLKSPQADSKDNGKLDDDSSNKTITEESNANSKDSKPNLELKLAEWNQKLTDIRTNLSKNFKKVKDDITDFYSKNPDAVKNTALAGVGAAGLATGIVALVNSMKKNNASKAEIRQALKQRGITDSKLATKIINDVGY